MFLESKPIPFTPPRLPDGVESVKDLSPDDLKNLMDCLNLDHKIDLALKNSNILYHKESKALYFPMHDVNKILVGYKILKRTGNDIIETSLPVTVNRFGLLSLKGTVGKTSKESTSCILVLSVLDFLALGTQKINGM